MNLTTKNLEHQEANELEDIMIDVAMDKLWPFIHDSKLLELCAPAVDKVHVLFQNVEFEEGLGTRRKLRILSEGESGHVTEVRSEHQPGKRVAFKILEAYNDRSLTDATYSLELEPFRYNQTRLIFAFSQNTEECNHPLVRGRHTLLRAIKRLAESFI